MAQVGGVFPGAAPIPLGWASTAAADAGMRSLPVQMGGPVIKSARISFGARGSSFSGAPNYGVTAAHMPISGFSLQPLTAIDATLGSILSGPNFPSPMFGSSTTPAFSHQRSGSGSQAQVGGHSCALHWLGMSQATGHAAEWSSMSRTPGAVKQDITPPSIPTDQMFWGPQSDASAFQELNTNNAHADAIPDGASTFADLRKARPLRLGGAADHLGSSQQHYQPGVGAHVFVSSELSEAERAADIRVATELPVRQAQMFSLPTPCSAPRRPQMSCPPLLVWRCQHAHGLFSMFSLALGHAYDCRKKGHALIVDWSSEELLYRGPPGEPNLWSAFFKQPAELTVKHSVLLHALRNGQFRETERHDSVFGAYHGVIQGYGAIPSSLAAYGRKLCRQSIALRDEFESRLTQLAERLLGGGRRWLAVHIRRGDKASEAKANFEIDDDEFVSKILTHCQLWQCDGVFLCSDDPGLKGRLKARLVASLGPTGENIVVSTYAAALSDMPETGTHFDKTIDAYQKAEDVVFECLLMARACHGLISTYSNVSAAVVYLSPDGYPYANFCLPAETADVPPVATPA